jgi:plasmid replication initiation protein
MRWAFRYRGGKSRRVVVVETLNRNYFRLDGGLERRLYELARKHCGQQSSWTISLELLHKKSGFAASLRKFRQLLKQVAADNRLPEYTLAYEADTDQVVFTR